MKSIDQELEEARRLLASYQDLAVEQEDDDAFVARGNGFCDRKYSEDFIQMQVAQLTARVAELEKKRTEQS
ncbi:MAG: hypothetical protein J6Y52_06305 [Bacteroidales bacterium]|nr:hypothetical protein [Bacteroidales bacterium]MBR6441191.1 hypothetical protein [Bacteroidales bacterium]